MPIFEYGERELNHLQRRDKVLGSAILKMGMIEREVMPDLFAALTNNIGGQQKYTAAAKTVWGRLLTSLGEISPKTIAGADAGVLQQCGLSWRKTEYIRGAADAVLNKKLDLAGLHLLPDQEAIKRLMQIKGVGVWTAEMLLIFGLQRPDVVSWGDQGIRRGMMKLYGLEILAKEQFDVYRQLYFPYGSVASLYLWEIAGQK